MATVVFLHAHPDDETIVTGGTMAMLADAGHRVVLVTATRGELGEFPEGFLAPGESLADRRTRELDAAASILGVARTVHLDYGDSGMEGEPSNSDPGCFAQTDVEAAAERVAAVLAEEGADVFVTYDEHGNYGHPDHVMVHRVGMRAAELAGTPRVYFATTNRDFLASLLPMAAEWGAEIEEDRIEALDTMGEPETRITTRIDATAYVRDKEAAMRAHASQIGETSFFLALPPEAFSVVWGSEWFIRVRGGEGPVGDDGRETSLLG